VLILAAALQVFADRGFDRATLDDIARLAGFTKGAVYSNFSSKDEVFYALLDQQIEHRLSATLQAVQSVTPAASASAIGEAMAAASVAEREWQLLFLDYWARAVRDPQLREQFVAHRRRLRSAIADALTEILPTQVGTLTRRDLATVALMLSNGYAIEALADPEDTRIELVGTVLQKLLS
jgi:AcrR family transcriptional regulator